MSDENKKVIVSGSITPSTKNTPLDIRTRVSTLDDIVNIQLPFVGMIFFVESEEKHYVVKSLKEKSVNGIVIPDMLVDVYEEFGNQIDIDLSAYVTQEYINQVVNDLKAYDQVLKEAVDGLAEGSGVKGDPGKSAYEVAVQKGFEGTEEEWLASLVGPQGIQGEQGIQGPQGEAFKYEDFTEEQLESLRGPQGNAFKYEDFTEEQLESLRGPQGEKGPQGEQGPRGYSAYQAWKTLEGNEEGTVEDFIQSITGKDFKYEDFTEEQLQTIYQHLQHGIDGKSAYEVAVQKGFEGTEEEWLASLVGPQGIQGEQGPQGEAFTYEDFTEEQLESLRGPQGEQGPRGYSAYQAWKTLEGNEEGTVEDFIKSLKGPQGNDGLSAYMIAKKYGHFEGSIHDWLRSLRGPQGKQGEAFTFEDFTQEQLESLRGPQGEQGNEGKSAYEIAKKYGGFEGTIDEWLESLVGPRGPKGKDFKYDDFTEEQLLDLRGEKGKDGKSAYELAKKYGGFEGTIDEWLESLQGPKGPRGKDFKYEDFTQEQLDKLAEDLQHGIDGKSAYELAVKYGFKGTEQEWLASLVGPQGPRGYSAYQAWKTLEGNEEGTVEDFIKSLKGLQGEVGPQGEQGVSAYKLAVEKGFEGTEEEWLASLVGPQGPQGEAFTFEDFTEEQLKSIIECIERGAEGKSAYELAVEKGFEGTEEEWLESLNGRQGVDGKPFTYEDFTEEQLAALQGPQGEVGPQGEAFKYEDFTEEQLESLRGPQGNAFTFEDFTEEQLESLRGPQGEQGPIGEAFTYEDFTEEQLAALQGPQGNAFTFEDFTEEQLESLRGPQGEAFKYEDFTEEQLESLRGPQGEKGQKGDPFNYEDLTEEQIAAIKGPQGDVGPQGELGPQGEQGVGIAKVEYNEEKHLIITLTDEQVFDVGVIHDIYNEEVVNNLQEELVKAQEEYRNVKQHLLDLEYGVDCEWAYIIDQTENASNKLNFNKENAPKFFEEWSPILESENEVMIENFINRVYEEDIYRLYVLKLTSEHRVYNRYEMIPLRDHKIQPKASEYIKNWNPTRSLEYWEWSSYENGGFTLGATPTSALTVALIKVKEEYRGIFR